MNKVKILFFFFVSMFIWSQHLNAQVQKVQYFMKYNEEKCLFDFHIVIKEGRAISGQHRAQLNAQYSVIVPAGSTVIMAEKHMPLQSNLQYNGTVPMDWKLASTILAPAVQSESDFYSIVPTLAPTSFYNNLNQNDTVKLFSLSITPITDCGKGVRIFNNQTDPGPLAAGMNGSNFSNGFTIGGIANKYDSNLASEMPKRPVITSLQSLCTNGIAIEIEADAPNTTCQRSLVYAWKGPEGFYSDQQNVSIPGAGLLQNGKYYITVKDTIGCSVTDSVMAYSKPDAGKDALVKCFVTGTTTLKAKGEGYWSFAANNPGTATLSDTSKNITVISGFTAQGLYGLIWNGLGCTDTVSVTVQNVCDCSFSNTLEIPDDYTYCSRVNDMVLKGNQVVEPGEYLWLYKNNTGSFKPAPGINNTKDYTVTQLMAGEHSFARSYIRTGVPVCKDTSNSLFLIISSTIDAGLDADLFCYSSDTAFIQANGQGHWVQDSSSMGILKIVQFGNPQQTFYDFKEAGEYTLYWVNESCTDTVSVFANPYCGCHEANGGENLTACAGDTITIEGTCVVGTWRSLAANPTGASLLSIQDGKTDIYFSRMAQGVYSFEYTVFDTLTDTVSVTVHTPPVINVGEDFGFCEGSPAVLLVAGGGVQYLWSNEETSSNIMVSPSATTTYRVTGFSEHGCASVDSVTVFILPKPAGIIPVLPISNAGTNVQLQSGVWTNAVQYFWQGPNNFSSTLQNPVIQNVNNSQSGIYTLTVTSAGDCVSTASVSLSVNQNPLPIYISQFSGEYIKEKEYIQLQCKTEYVINHDYLLFEKSEDGLFFEKLEVVYTNGKSGIYQIFDHDVENGKTYFYRVVSFDLDGTFQIFETISVKADDVETISVHMYPVPTRDYIQLSFSGHFKNDLVEIEIIGLDGTSLYSQQHTIQTVIRLDDIFAYHTAPGTYFLKLVVGDQVIIRPIIKI
ncbi:MAG: T9SS type A sorting domain-containing protein [Saprospiraceae bacterium]|nr:T9SS type A sorting domain-containing protein [Saprospiraceae bacterium]